ncbi:MAG: hypothetical protein J5631_08810 [Spirochaetaceae bacterium]|nr:hypothetical protein [Spirochaetaceae bacterium]
MHDSLINYPEIDLFLKNEFQYENQNISFDIKGQTPDYGTINDYITPSEDILQEKIRKTILAKNLDEVDIYKKADVDRKLFSKIRTQPDYHPNKKTLLKLCLAMNLDTNETEDLLSTAGYSLSKSLRSDLILRYCFTHHIFDVIAVNQILDHYGENVI